MSEQTFGEGSWSAPSGPPADEDRAWAAPEAGADIPTRDPLDTSTGPVATDSRPRRSRLPVPLRPMTYSDLLDGSFAIFKSHPGVVFGVSAVILVPLHLVVAVLQRNVVSSSFTDISDLLESGGTTSRGPSNADVGLSYLGIALLTLGVFLLGAALARAVSAWYAGGELTASEILKATGQRLPHLVAAWAIMLPANAVAAACGFVGYVFLMPLFVVVAPAMMAERLGPIRGIQRGVQLVSRRYFPVLGVVWLGTIAVAIATNALTTIPQLIGVALGSPWDWIIIGGSTTLAALVLTPALVGLAVLVYLDLRIRTEGLDLELQAADAFPVAT